MPVLPPEILAMIFRYLVPERSAATADKPPYDKLSSSALYRGLINVSRAGKHFHNLAKPLLLEKVVLSNCPNMYKFFRTLVQDPEKGKHIKHLSLDFPVNDNFNVYSIPPNLLQEAAVIVRTLPERHTFKEAISSVLERGTRWHGRSALIAVFILLLSLSNHIESMDIRLLAPWTTWVRHHAINDTDPLQRMLWDFLLRQRRLQVENPESDGHTRVFQNSGDIHPQSIVLDGRLVGDRHNGEPMHVGRLHSFARSP